MLSNLRRLASKFFSLAKRELSVVEELHGEVRATLDRLEAKDPGLGQLLENAFGYAVFPAVGKASAVIGAAFGKGEVFRKGNLIGYTAVAQLTIGVQLGGQTFSEVIAFQNKAAMDRFRAGRYAFAANASAVLVKAGAAATNAYQDGVLVLVHADGGMMLELALGGQKFFFAPAALGRGKSVKPSKAGTKAASTGATSKAATRASGPRKSQPVKSAKRAPQPRSAGRATERRGVEKPTGGSRRGTHGNGRSKSSGSR